FYAVDNTTVFAIPTEVGSQINVIYFPKCCPPEYVFQAKKHKCIYNNTIPALYDDWGLNVSVIKSGLSNCEVIVDKKLTELKLENFKRDRKFLFNNELFSYGDYCLDKMHDEDNYIARLCYSRDYCTKAFSERKDWCLRKCCKDGYVLKNIRNCILRPDLGLNIENDLDVIKRNDSFAQFTDNRSCRMYEARKGSLNFSIREDGSFLIFEKKVWKEYKVNELMYCTDTSFNTTTKESRNVFKLCVISNANDLKFKIATPAMIISCTCLTITILIYIFVYKLQKVIQGIIVCYCFFLMLFYIMTILVHTIRDLRGYCEVVGFVLFSSYIASFAWMNVLCFDIYRTVS
ncbi:hypothetical protein AMK59_2037, partial [Oryctes borbonicus]